MILFINPAVLLMFFSRNTKIQPCIVVRVGSCADSKMQTHQFVSVSDCSKKSHAKFYDMRGGVRAVDVCERRRLMATVGGDREVKIWSLRDVM